jgi:general secretion pathway protein K
MRSSITPSGLRTGGDSQGVILIAVLWILTILSVIALSFSRETFVEVAAARNQRDLTDSYYIARAGIAVTIYKLYEKMLLPQTSAPGLQALEPDGIDMGKVTGQFADGEYQVDVQDESGKVNLNVVREDQLRALVNAIGIPQPDADVIVDSILDWRDPGTIPRQNGAKDDYYLSLENPYQIWKENSRMKAVEELLLIRGITPEYYYGRREKTPDGRVAEFFGLSRFLTVYGGTTNRININYAPLQVLQSIPGMPPASAQSIFDRCKTKPFTSWDEINREVSPNPGPGILQYISWQRTSVWTLTASAHRSGSKANRVIRAVVRLNVGGRDKYSILNWNENIPNW